MANRIFQKWMPSVIVEALKLYTQNANWPQEV